MIKRFLLLLAIFLGGMEAGWGQNIVTDVPGLKEAITKAHAGEVITIAAGTYGSENAIESFGVVRAANVTIKAATDVKPKLYGTIQLMEEGCTVEGLAFYTKGGVHPIKNAIDVVAMSATIKGNEFNLLKPEVGYVGNGVCIWPFGDPSSTSYTISGNTFKAFDASTPNWSSTALSIAEGCELSRFEGKNSTDVSKTAVVIPDELSLWTGNTFVNCYTDYVRSSWTYEENANAVKKAPVYSFTCVSSNADALKTAVNYSKDQAKIHIKGSYAFDSKLVIARSILLTGTPGSQATLSATGSFSDNLVSVENTKEVAIENVKITGSPKYGLHVFNSTDVTITGTTLSANKWGGMLVNGSTVTAANVTTENNTLGGIEVGKGGGVKNTPKLTLKENCQIRETAAQIWADTDVTKEPVIAEWVSGNGWSMYEANSGNGKQTFWRQKVAPVLTAPVASTLEAGQALSVSLLKGGSAQVGSVAIAGLFSWKNPVEEVTEGTHSYVAVFTPSDLVKYSVVEIPVEIKDVKQYYTVTTGKSANGKVIINGANGANKYAKDTTLGLTTEADLNYKFSKWLDNASVSYKVTKNDMLTAEFTAIKHTITIAVTGNGTVNVNGESKGNGATVSVQQGTALSVVAVPVDGNMLTSFSCSEGKVISNGTVVVDQPFTITATFDTKPADQFVVNVSSDISNGKILLFDTNGNAVSAGSAVITGTELSVLAVADPGYEAGEITGASITEGKCTITEATTLSVAFTKQKYAVIFANPTGGTIAVSNDTNNGATVDYGTELMATVASADGYKLLSLLVNGKEIPNGGTFTVTAATNVTAVMRKLATLIVDKEVQTVVYDGTEKGFVVKTTPAGVGGFTVTYNATPKEVDNHVSKEYTVTIKRDADDVYASVHITDAKLIIEAAEMKGVPEPTFNGETLNTAGIDGSYVWVDEQGNDSAIKEVAFTPTSKNHKVDTFSVWNHKGAEPGTISYNPNQSRAALRADAGSLVVNTTGGSVVVLNGTTPVSGTLYIGQVLTLKGIPSAGKSAKATWIGTTNPVDGRSASITLGTGTNTAGAVFAAKSDPTVPTLTTATTPYTGAIFGGITPVTSALGWNITFKQGETIIPAPTNAGTYTVIASRPEDEFDAAVENKAIGTFTIEPVAAIATVTSVTAILQGQSLAQSIITGTADVDGAFEWETPNAIMSTVGIITGQNLKFVPTNINYAASGVLTTAVEIKAVAGVTLRTLNLAVTNPDKGEAVQMTLNGTEVASGTIVTKDDKVKVTFKTTASGYTASATINGTPYTSGDEYPVTETGNVDVKISYTYSGGGTETVDVTGVSLNATTEALAVGAEFTLVATVTPTGATNKGVTWASSDPAIASVDANGKVKALKAGTCKITVTTDDGAYTASCDVTVSVPTGIDEILANSRIYTRNGAICIDPAHPVEVVIISMTGVVVYRDQLTDSRQISVSAGTYLVRLSEGKQIATVKVFVR